MNYSNVSLIAEVTAYVSNRRNVDKYGIAYLLEMMNYKRFQFTTLAVDTWKRAELLAYFVEEANNPEHLAKLNNGTCMKDIFEKHAKWDSWKKYKECVINALINLFTVSYTVAFNMVHLHIDIVKNGFKSQLDATTTANNIGNEYL